MRKIPFENLSWIKVYERVQGDPRSRIPWDAPPLGVTNRPLYELLQNDRSLILRLVDAIYALRDIGIVLENFSPSHTDVVIKRQGIRIPKLGVVPSEIHSDLDVRISSIGTVERQYRNRRGRCSYTDHADFHEDIAHKDYPGHGDLHLDTTEHGDETRSTFRLLNKPLWVARYLPPNPETSVFMLGHADHGDVHLDVSFAGNAPQRASHADRSISGEKKDFVYLPFWRTEDLERFISTGRLPSGIEVAVQEAFGAHYDWSGSFQTSPSQFRMPVHGDHMDNVHPVQVSYTVLDNREESDPIFGMYPSVLESEVAGGLTVYISENLQHTDSITHSDLHTDYGFGFHGDLNHHDTHYDEFVHCDFTAPHGDYTDHANYPHLDETQESSGHTDHTDHANVAHGDSAFLSLSSCVHQDSPIIHGDFPQRPHADHADHSDFFTGDEFSPHLDEWGGMVFHSDYRKPPTHFDHMDYSALGVWGIPVPGLNGVFIFSGMQYFINSHYDLYSQNNHSDETLTFPPGINPHMDHADQEDYRYFHTDLVKKPFWGLLPGIHEDITQHGDKPHGDFIFVGRTHQDQPAKGGSSVHGDTIIYQDVPFTAHADHTDHSDSEHCDYPPIDGHVDAHYDVPHANYSDHANIPASGGWHQDSPHHDHTDHTDI